MKRSFLIGAWWYMHPIKPEGFCYRFDNPPTVPRALTLKNVNKQLVQLIPLTKCKTRYVSCGKIESLRGFNPAYSGVPYQKHSNHWTNETRYIDITHLLSCEILLLLIEICPQINEWILRVKEMMWNMFLGMTLDSVRYGQIWQVEGQVSTGTWTQGL